MEETSVKCPFCGEMIDILIDCSEDEQTYVEDCSVCCRPIVFHLICRDGSLIQVTPARE